MEKRMRILPMTETADTSSKGTATSHYDYLRFDLPWDMVNIVGFRWYRNLRVYQDSLDSKKFYLSVLPLNKPDAWEYRCDVMYQKKNGWMNSKDINIEVDDVYTMIPKEYLQSWEADSEVEYTYVPETETEERHVEVKHSSYSS